MGRQLDFVNKPNQTLHQYLKTYAVNSSLKCYHSFFTCGRYNKYLATCVWTARLQGVQSDGSCLVDRWRLLNMRGLLHVVLKISGNWGRCAVVVMSDMTGCLISNGSKITSRCTWNFVKYRTYLYDQTYRYTWWGKVGFRYNTVQYENRLYIVIWYILSKGKTWIWSSIHQEDTVLLA